MRAPDRNELKTRKVKCQQHVVEITILFHSRQYVQIQYVKSFSACSHSEGITHHITVLKDHLASNKFLLKFFSESNCEAVHPCFGTSTKPNIVTTQTDEMSCLHLNKSPQCLNLAKQKKWIEVKRKEKRRSLF